ncbi:MAG: right-handed parallel beta-helix repeat-containing protein [bacterium]|nr:right-handed parallel beta-helix repeat-containing protein [bacterium]
MPRQLRFGFISLLLVIASPTLTSFALVITSPSTLPDAVKGEFYSFQLQTEGAIGDVTWEIETGAMAYVEVETPHRFAGTTNATGIISTSDTKVDVPLPFNFPFYGETYQKLLVSSAGYMGFKGIGGYRASASYFYSSVAGMAPLMAHLYIETPGDPLTGDGVFAEAVAWRCVVTWRGRSSSTANQDREFQGIIYPSGHIAFNYGNGNHNLQALIAISAGDDAHYLYSAKDGATDLENAPSSRFMLSALPPQIELHGGTGILSGTPTEFRVWAFRATATDSGSEAPSVSKVFSITVPGLSIHTRPGGVFIRKGEPGAISWGGGGIGDTVTVRLYRGGELVETILDNAPNEEGIMWQPPDELPLADDYTVVVEDSSVPPLTDSKPLTIWDEYVLVPQCCPTVQEGVDLARDGDTVLISPGTYVGSVLIQKNITLAGADGGETILDAGGKQSPLTIIKAENVTARDMTIAYAGGDAFGNIHCIESTVTIDNCKIHSGEATFGAGIFFEQCVALVTNSEISGNSAEQAGGGLYAWASQVVIRDCIVKENAAKEGGGLFFWYSVPQVVRTVVAKNQAETGAGIFCDEAAPVIVNCTIADNIATLGAGGVHCQTPAPVLSSPIITNSIIWGNGVAISNAGRMKISYSDIDDPAFAGSSGNISAPPMFVDASAGDYHLAGGSPCVDAGNPDPLYNDADGSTCDMGAFGGTGYAPQQTWITHIIRRFVDLTENIDVYWRASAFTDAVGQVTEELLSVWSEGSALAPDDKWTPTGTDALRQKFFRVVPAE